MDGRDRSENCRAGKEGEVAGRVVLLGVEGRDWGGGSRGASRGSRAQATCWPAR